MPARAAAQRCTSKAECSTRRCIWLDLNSPFGVCLEKGESLDEHYQRAAALGAIGGQVVAVSDLPFPYSLFVEDKAYALHDACRKGLPGDLRAIEKVILFSTGDAEKTAAAKVREEVEDLYSRMSVAKQEADQHGAACNPIASAVIEYEKAPEGSEAARLHKAAQKDATDCIHGANLLTATLRRQYEHCQTLTMKVYELQKGQQERQANDGG